MKFRWPRSQERPLATAGLGSQSATVTGGETAQRAAVVRVEAPVKNSPEEIFEEFRAVCESAVDPLEIASALEFDGMNDAMVFERYGYSDVFALAEEMFRRVPRRPVDPPPVADFWQFSKFRPVLHGLLYGLPAVCFPAASGLLAGPGVLPTLVVALLVAWSLSQGLASLGYARLGRSSTGEERALLRIGLAAALGVVVLTMAVTTLIVGARLPVFWFGVGEGAYMLGACVLMVLGVGRWLLVALVPGVACSAVFLALGRPAGLEHVVWAALAATPLLALALAVAVTRRAGPSVGRVCTSDELRGALPAAGFGLIAAGLLAYPVAAGVDGHGGVNVGALLASLPISLSMGAAEASLLWYRRRAQRLLRTTTELRTFTAKVRLTLYQAVLQYIVVALVLTAVVIVIATSSGLVAQLTWTELVQIAAYLMLGSAMFVALTVQALGLRAFTISACAAALAFELVFSDFGLTAQVVACGGLLFAVGCYASLRLGNALRHG